MMMLLNNDALFPKLDPEYESLYFRKTAHLSINPIEKSIHKKLFYTRIILDART